MSTITIRLDSADYTSRPLSENHFGANAIFIKDYLDPGGPFERFIQQLNIDILRWPGGTVTEEMLAPGSRMADRLYSLTRPSGIGEPGEERLLTAPALFGYTIANRMDVIYTIPTNNYLSSIRDEGGNRVASPFGTFRLIDRIDEIIRGYYGPVDLKIIQIGNEFWYQNERESATEYGRIVNEIAIALSRVFELYRQELDDPESWVAPKIAMQVTQGFAPEDTAAILAEMLPEARAAISVVTQHFYPRTYEVIANSPGVFDRLDDIGKAEGFGPLEYYLSEWNVRSDLGDRGLLQASSLLQMVRVFMERGVDYATIWGTQYLNLATRLSELFAADTPSGFDYRLTVAGELFGMMNPGLVGLRVIGIDTDRSLRVALAAAPEDRPEEQRDQAVMHAFGSDDRVVVFISSRTDRPMDIALDPAGLIPSWTHLWGQSLGVLDDPATAPDEGDPTAGFARPFIRLHGAETLVEDGVVRFTLGAWEIMRLEFSIGVVDLTISGQTQLVDPAADHDDSVRGGAGDDSLLGHLGDDTLYGGAGGDSVFGGVGDDLLYGGDGDDLLIGGDGNDTLYGGSGEDTLVSGLGGSVLWGGAGPSHFIIDPAGDAKIRDFSAEDGDTLSFLDAYRDPVAVLSRIAVSGTDLIIDHAVGGRTVLVDGASQFGRIADALSDFMPSSPVAAIVGDLTAEQPNGEVPADPPGDPVPADLAELRRFEAVLNADDPAAAQALLAAYTPAQLIILNAMIEPSVLVLTLRPFVLNFYLALLDDAGRDSFFDRLNPLALAYRLSDNLTPTLWRNPDLQPEITDRILRTLRAEDGPMIFGDWSDADLRTFMETLDLRGLDALDYPIITALGPQILQIHETLDLVRTGGADSDVLTGRSGNDRFNGLGGNDRIDGRDGSDTLIGGRGNDSLFGGAGNDRLLGRDGNDRLEGSGGGDRLSGNGGNDTLFGGDGNDRLNGMSGNDTLYGDEGNDRLKGNAGDDALFGGLGNDTIFGGAGNNTLSGGAGNDSLVGGVGEDWLEGGSGNDTLRGGAGNDTFVFRGGQSVIEDFAQLQRDRLLIDRGLVGGALLDGAEIIARYGEVRGGMVRFDFGAENGLRIEGVAAFDGLAPLIELI